MSAATQGQLLQRVPEEQRAVALDNMKVNQAVEMGGGE